MNSSEVRNLFDGFIIRYEDNTYHETVFGEIEVFRSMVSAYEYGKRIIDNKLHKRFDVIRLHESETGFYYPNEFDSPKSTTEDKMTPKKLLEICEQQRLRGEHSASSSKFDEGYGHAFKLFESLVKELIDQQ